jgi:2-haloacid dehalogenase
MSPRGDRWVTFDCFGTLVDWNSGFAAVIESLAGARWRAVLDAYHRIEPRLEMETPHRLYKNVLADGLAQAAADNGVTLSEGAAQSLAAAWGTLPVFGDVEPMLASLRSSGYRLGVLTNCDEDLFEQTHRSFRQRFDLVRPASYCEKRTSSRNCRISAL